MSFATFPLEAHETKLTFALCLRDRVTMAEVPAGDLRVAAVHARAGGRTAAASVLRLAERPHDLCCAKRARYPLLPAGRYRGDAAGRIAAPARLSRYRARRVTGLASSRARTFPWDSQRPQPVLKEGETRRLRSSDAFSDVLKILAMQLNQITERFRLTRASYQSGFAAIDTPLDIECPFLGVLAAEERPVDILSFPPHLDSPGARFELCESRQNVCAPCALSRRTAAKRVA